MKMLTTVICVLFCGFIKSQNISLIDSTFMELKDANFAKFFLNNQYFSVNYHNKSICLVKDLNLLFNNYYLNNPIFYNSYLTYFQSINQSNHFLIQKNNSFYHIIENQGNYKILKLGYYSYCTFCENKILCYNSKKVVLMDSNLKVIAKHAIQHEFVKEQMYKYPFPYFFINYDGKYFYLHYPFSPTIFVKNENFQNIFTINNPNWGITDIHLYTQQMHPNQISVRQTVNYTFNSFQYFPITIQDRYIYQLSVPNYSKEFSEQVLDLYFEDKLEPDYYLTLYNQSDYKVVFNERFKGLPHYFDGFIYEFIKKENGLWIKKYKVNLLSTK